MTDDTELVKNFVKESDLSEEIKSALLQALTLEKLSKPETEFDRLVKKLADSRSNENK